MLIEENVSLRSFNTFGLDYNARYLIEAPDLPTLLAVLKSAVYKQNPFLILGGGSNILFTRDFDGLVIKINLMGINPIKEDKDHIWLSVGAGEIWHDLVLRCVADELGGIENLSLIPGTVGAAPMQNIGAYGVEIKEVFEYLEAVHISTSELQRFNYDDCQFGYRESVFKKSLKGQFIITKVVLRLSKHPVFNTSYGALKTTLDQMDGETTIKKISDAVISIRQQKLPDPREIGNAGSFFKNPVIDKALFHEIRSKNQQIPSYPAEFEKIKVPAAWLIESCGWKGKRLGNVGVHTNQALVLVNYGNGEGAHIKQLAMEIQETVKKNFGIELEPEVNIV